jgi:hypothetical protein
MHRVFREVEIRGQFFSCAVALCALYNLTRNDEKVKLKLLIKKSPFPPPSDKRRDGAPPDQTHRQIHPANARDPQALAQTIFFVYVVRDRRRSL